MELKQAAKLASYTGADANQDNLTSKNTQVSKAIEDTPLRIVKNEEGWFIAFQQQRITEIFENEDTLINFMQFGDLHEIHNDDNEREIGFYARQAWKTICVLAGAISQLSIEMMKNEQIEQFKKLAQYYDAKTIKHEENPIQQKMDI